MATPQVAYSSLKFLNSQVLESCCCLRNQAFVLVALIVCQALMDTCARTNASPSTPISAPFWRALFRCSMEGISVTVLWKSVVLIRWRAAFWKVGMWGVVMAANHVRMHEVMRCLVVESDTSGWQSGWIISRNLSKCQRICGYFREYSMVHRCYISGHVLLLCYAKTCTCTSCFLIL